MLTCFVNCSANDVSDFDRKLRAFRYTEWKDDTDSATLEAECLGLIVDHNTPLEKGKIYATMAFIYSDRGYGPDDASYIATQALRYSMKALEYPLDPLTACYMYVRGSDALVAQSRGDPNRTFVEAREQAVDLCLKGLKLALDNNAPKEYPPSPGPATNIGLAPGLLIERMIELNKRQIEAREKWLYETEFSGLRQGLFRRCLSLYAHKPYDREKFWNKALKTLKGHEQTAAELIAALEAQNVKMKAMNHDESERLSGLED
jgi:hypothetical protein